ncbi:hypothetical protein E1301_Tti020288 [Triplophysa tibetana]|uniref:Uncharacterized protein n=1 Tax=Triplophysa tibetana TaxID=1572043 RepID=A0A5A9NQE6_9TELE|nr:hypothetical protein E1301_Tti020288 [Triplophysa tibetana]
MGLASRAAGRGGNPTGALGSLFRVALLIFGLWDVQSQTVANKPNYIWQTAGQDSDPAESMENAELSGLTHMERDQFMGCMLFLRCADMVNRVENTGEKHMEVDKHSRGDQALNIPSHQPKFGARVRQNHSEVG